MNKLLLLPIGLLALASCNDKTASRTDTDQPTTLAPSERTDDMTSGPSQTLDATNAAVRSAGGDITALPLRRRRQHRLWLTQLNDVDGADKVTANLRVLQKTLTSSDINGQLAGMLLITLAEDTRQVAGSSMGIGMLASALEAGGEKLTAATITGTSMLSETLMAVKGKMGDITTPARERRRRQRGRVDRQAARHGRRRRSRGAASPKAQDRTTGPRDRRK